MKYLFWNTGKKNINTILRDLIIKSDCHIIGLAEYEDDINNLISTLSANGLHYFKVDKIGCNRIDILTRITPGKVEPFGESTYYTIKKFPHESLGTHLVTFVHLPSKLHCDEYDFIFIAKDLKDSIEEAERDANLSYSIVVGDFNMNPFESAMIAGGSLHSVPCRRVANSQQRKIKGESFSMFYNPMWNLFGDMNEPPGTYFYNKAVHVNYYWNMFDQVLVRPSLCNNFINSSLEIITDINGVKLVDINGRPCVSDHLPLAFEIK